MLVDILTEDGVMLAKVVGEHENTKNVRYLTPTKSRDDGCVVYDWEDDVCEVEESSVQGYYDTDDMRCAGFRRVPGGYVMTCEFDDDYSPSEEDSDTDDSELFCDSDSNNEEY